MQELVVRGGCAAENVGGDGEALGVGEEGERGVWVAVLLAEGAHEEGEEGGVAGGLERGVVVRGRGFFWYL